MMWQQRIYTSSWPHMVVPPADLCSRVQHSSLLIYWHLEQKQGRQGKAARTPTHHMLFLMIENGGCAQCSPNLFHGPVALQLLCFYFPHSSPLHQRIPQPGSWGCCCCETFLEGTCEDAIAATYSPLSYTAQCQGTWLWSGNCIFFPPNLQHSVFLFSSLWQNPPRFPDLWLVPVLLWHGESSSGKRQENPVIALLVQIFIKHQELRV